METLLGKIIIYGLCLMCIGFLVCISILTLKYTLLLIRSGLLALCLPLIIPIVLLVFIVDIIYTSFKFVSRKCSQIHTPV